MENICPTVPAGFRFYPTEEELVSFYLQNKLRGTRQDLDRVIPILYIYHFNPGDLPQFAGELCRGDPEQWFFFVPRQEKEARGGRPSRLTASGYWKATGSPGYVYSSNNKVIGVKRTMVFYTGRAPTGRKTDWKMNEYRAIDGEESSSSNKIPKLRQELSLCRVYRSSTCLRSFDRLPPPTVAAADPTLMVHPTHHSGNDRATTSRDDQNHPIMEIRSSLSERSSLGNHVDVGNDLSQMVASDNWDLLIENQPLWDWEQLNWF
ncbi:NAC domain-containing protein 90-like [Diospyros lotus]|uniref:NAC domain-containing protein 90-like n=1 Tax=Diospyros lotus TaxID=55363 RepID=UPI002258329B|nr:NAC domain-containing protein 90-like [Diospyros lotus]